MNTVFSLPELLESIILELPREDVLVSANICILWRDLVSTSAKIYGHIFKADHGKTHATSWGGSDLPNIFFVKLEWGTLLIRRLHGSEFMAILRGPLSQYPKLEIIDGKRKTVTFHSRTQWRGPVVWGVRFRDPAAERFEYENIIG